MSFLASPNCIVVFTERYEYLVQGSVSEFCETVNSRNFRINYRYEHIRFSARPKERMVLSNPSAGSEACRDMDVSPFFVSYFS
jgi:hypothetical protein